MKNPKEDSKFLENYLLRIENDYDRIGLFTPRVSVFFKLIPTLGLAYSIVILLIILVKNDFALPTFQISSNSNVQTQELQDQVLSLSSKVQLLESSIKTASSSSNLELRVVKLETGQKNLSDSIDMDIDKALTARVLQEKQKNIESEITTLQSSQSDTNRRIDGLITTVVAVPLGGIALSLITSLVYFLFGRNSKKEAIQPTPAKKEKTKRLTRST